MQYYGTQGKFNWDHPTEHVFGKITNQNIDPTIEQLWVRWYKMGALGEIIVNITVVYAMINQCYKGTVPLYL